MAITVAAALIGCGDTSGTGDSTIDFGDAEDAGSDAGLDAADDTDGQDAGGDDTGAPDTSVGDTGPGDTGTDEASDSGADAGYRSGWCEERRPECGRHPGTLG